MAESKRILWQMKGWSEAPTGLRHQVMEITAMTPMAENSYGHVANIRIESEVPIVVRSDGRFLTLLLEQ